jgi:acid phosphatase (class A)
MPPPPDDDSPQAKAELAELQHIAATRTPGEWKAAMADEEDETPTAFAGVFGSGFDLKSLPQTAHMLADLRNDQKIAATAAKVHFLRSRPWILDPDLKSCTREEAAQSSYPSGHSTFGFSVAVVLASAAPDKAAALLARAKDYAENRLVCSMHYRSDVVAGEALGTVVAEDLLHNPQFRQELDASHRELVAAHLTAGP